MNPDDRSKSICVVTNAYPDVSSPYPMYGRFVKELVDHLTENGLTLSVVTPRLFPQNSSNEMKGWERVYRFWFWSDNRRLVEYRRVPVFRMLTYLISGVLKTIRIVRKNSCRLIHAHWAIPAGLIAVVVGRVLRKPVVLTVHGSDARWAFERKGLVGSLFGWTARRADFVTTVSQNIAEKMMSIGIMDERILVFPMGVSDEFFSPLPARLPRSEHNGKTVIVSNRHLLPAYSVDCLIRAIPHVVEEFPEVLFLIIGDGERRSVLESMARRMRLLPWVQFLGPVDHGQMPGVLRSSQIYVSTSPSDGASVSLLEAMACGLFPVVTDIPANREWIRDGHNGCLVPPDDERALASGIKTALRDKAVRERAGGMNVELAREKASWWEICETLKNLYQRLATE
jgi:glycosyltransferase involved in cell wall biosynthesis